MTVNVSSNKKNVIIIIRYNHVRIFIWSIYFWPGKVTTVRINNKKRLWYFYFDAYHKIMKSKILCFTYRKRINVSGNSFLLLRCPGRHMSYSLRKKSGLKYSKTKWYLYIIIGKKIPHKSTYQSTVQRKILIYVLIYNKYIRIIYIY